MVDSCLTEWEELEKEFVQLSDDHAIYCQKVDEVKSIQRKCMSSIAHQRYRIKHITEAAHKLKKDCDADVRAKLTELEKNILKRKEQFRELEDVLPHENGLYLKIVLGSVNVSLLSKHDKFCYKEDYERFKLYVTLVTLILALIMWFFVNYRENYGIFHFPVHCSSAMYELVSVVQDFLLVWYYCTLTIREHILRVNGSRIKGWWMMHHFISTVTTGILLIWPDGYAYHEFRNQFVIFSMYLSVVQLMQYYYQSGSLYRLRALGERRSMDLTVEGFQSWMWKGLTFLLPFLLAGYLFQLYNAYVLYNLARDEKCKEWQVLVLSILFLVLGLGNTYTMTLVVRQKIREKLKQTLYFSWRNKYRFSSNGNLGTGNSGS